MGDKGGKGEEGGTKDFLLVERRQAWHIGKWKFLRVQGVVRLSPGPYHLRRPALPSRTS